ncbi:Peroxisomal (S)-2-hydroxy-acid oxidase GLO4 [Triticum urartu]|uniref:(S)-2-hydroxy-acid oxidase n=1 Tax=Triticum urartu TaxID=4572 RepID=M7Z5I2_TRIUA|nr:Peroxisomal (S)-2-hydroxy-acid oxidase GLO4 [Triticum urartu]
MENNLPVNIREYQELAKKALSKMHYDYINGGAEDEHTLRDNIAAYGRILYFPIDLNLIGKIFIDLKSLDLKTFLVFKKRDVSSTLVRRAESNGFKAIVLTVDTPVFGRREADIRNKMVASPKPNLEGLISIDDLNTTGGSQIEKYARDTLDPSLSWKFQGQFCNSASSIAIEHADIHVETYPEVEWLKSITSLPILLKGIVTAEDARKAVEAGVAGVIVSNHGGRQLDYAPATISVLEEKSGPKLLSPRAHTHLLDEGGGLRRLLHDLRHRLSGAVGGSDLPPKRGNGCNFLIMEPTTLPPLNVLDDDIHLLPAHLLGNGTSLKGPTVPRSGSLSARREGGRQSGEVSGKRWSGGGRPARGGGGPPVRQRVKSSRHGALAGGKLPRHRASVQQTHGTTLRTSANKVHDFGETPIVCQWKANISVRIPLIKKHVSSNVVVKAVAGAVPVLVDGGIRRGTDVLKALALGARAVMVGRPVLYGLAARGEAGAKHVIEMLNSELRLAHGALRLPEPRRGHPGPCPDRGRPDQVAAMIRSIFLFDPLDV